MYIYHFFCRVDCYFSFKDPCREQEYKDAVCLGAWKSAINAHNRVACPDELRDYLDANIPEWREDHRRNRGRFNFDYRYNSSKLDNNNKNAFSRIPEKMEQSIESLILPTAEAVVKRYEERGSVLPSLKVNCLSDPSRAQESTNASQLHNWKKHKTQELPSKESTDEQNQSHIYATLLKVRDIVRRCNSRVTRGMHCLPRHVTGREDSFELETERNDALTLSAWKRELQSTREHEQNVLWEVKMYLDKELPKWVTVGSVSPETYSHSFHSAVLFAKKENTQNNKGAYHSSFIDPQMFTGVSYHESNNNNMMTIDRENTHASRSYSSPEDSERDGITALLLLKNGTSPPSSSSSASLSSIHSYDFDTKKPCSCKRDRSMYPFCPTAITLSNCDADNEGPMSKRARPNHSFDSSRKKSTSPATSTEVPSSDSDSDFVGYVMHSATQSNW